MDGNYLESIWFHQIANGTRLHCIILTCRISSWRKLIRIALTLRMYQNRRTASPGPWAASIGVWLSPLRKKKHRFVDGYLPRVWPSCHCSFWLQVCVCVCVCLCMCVSHGPFRAKFTLFIRRFATRFPKCDKCNNQTYNVRIYKLQNMINCLVFKWNSSNRQNAAHMKWHVRFRFRGLMCG